MQMRSALKTINHKCDVCVIGGGLGGVLAAVSAARHGAYHTAASTTASTRHEMLLLFIRTPPLYS